MKGFTPTIHAHTVGLYLGKTTNLSYWKPAIAIVARDLPGAHVRLMCDWLETETAPGQYKWPDAAIAACADAGLPVHLCVSKTPSWAQAGTPDPKRGPDDPMRYGEFISALAWHYGSQVSHIEIWNEPNAEAFFHASPGLSRSESYVRLLDSVYDYMYPTTVDIVAGNSDGRYATAAAGIAQDDWLKSCQAFGVVEWDHWATHNYTGNPANRCPEFQFKNGRSPWGVVDTLAALAGPVAISEVGFLCAGEAATYSDPPTLETQARYTQRHLIHALARRVPYYSIMFVRDFSGNCKGMFDTTTSPWTPRPVWRAVCETVERLRGFAAHSHDDIGDGNWCYNFRRVDPSGPERREEFVTVAWTNEGEFADESGHRKAADPQNALPITLTNDVQWVVMPA